MPTTRPGARARVAVTAVPLLLAALVGACGTTASPTPTTPATSSSSATPTATSSPSPTDAASATPSVEPSASGSPDAETVYRRIEEAVEPLRGLEAKDDVDPQLMTEDELKERTEQSFTEDNPPGLIEANEVLYRALGMLDEEDSLQDLYLELLGSQVAGFYDPEVDELFVITRSGGLGVSERVTYAHEYTHALQDQHFDLDSFGLDVIGEGDRNVAVLSLIEGDATAVMTEWAALELTSDELLELFEQSLDPEAMRILNEVPPILRESLTFPYDRGLQFVSLLKADGGWEAVDEAYADPPASTEQVMHPAKYESREAPIKVDLPDDLADRMGEGWESTYEDTFGEFQFQVWLRYAIGRMDEGSEAAAGWGGDRFAVLQGPGDAWALAMATEWDSEADATDFAAAAPEGLTESSGVGRVLPGEGGTVRWVIVAHDDATLERLAGVLGLAG